MLLFPAALLECDAVIYACAGLGQDLIQSTDAGHLVWGSLEWRAAELGRLADPPLHPIALLRWLSLISALFGVWLLYRLCVDFGLERRLSALLAGVFLFSYSHWHFALQAEPHLPSTVCLVWFAWLAWRYHRQPTVRGAVLTALVLGLATLLHQTAILLVPAFMVLAGWDRTPGAGWRRQLSAFVAVYFLIVVVPYLLVAILVRDLHTVSEIKDWILGLSAMRAWGYWTWTTPAKAAIGFLRSVVGSHFMLGLDPVMAFASRVFPHASWQDELLLAERVSPVMRYFLTVLELGVLAALARGLWLLPRRLRRTPSTEIPFLAFLLVWTLGYGGFIMWWAPERAEFWIAVILPLLVLAGLAWRGLDNPRRMGRLGGGFLAALFLVNFLGSIRPQSGTDLEPETRLLTVIDTVTARGDFLLSDSSLGGRATMFVYTLEKINLLKPTLQRPGMESPRAEGAPGGGGGNRPVWRTEAGDDPVGYAVTVVDSVLAWAGREGKSVYLLKTPLMRDAESHDRLAEVISRLEDRHRMSAPVPLRADADLVRILSPDFPAE